MDPQDPLDVPFCDLCNTSIPLQDLGTGAAIRHQGKTIGACCLAVLQKAPSTSAPAAAPAVAQPRSPEVRLLSLGITLLAAIAAATLFVDYRLHGLDERDARSFADIGDKLRSHADVLQKVSVDLDGVVRRTDFDGLGERFTAIDAACQRLGEQFRSVLDQQDKLVAAVAQKLHESELRRPDYAPLLGELRQQLQNQAMLLAELKAQPRAPESAPMPAAPEAQPVPAGLNPALAHQVQKLKDEDPAARFVAVDELLHSKNPAVLEHLLPMAKDSDAFVRRLTVEGLKDFKQAAVVEVLLAALADPEQIVADTAWRSLKELTGQKLPFDAGATREARARAQQKWQEWWEKNRAGFGS